MSRSWERNESSSGGRRGEADRGHSSTGALPAAGFGQADRGYAELVGALVAVVAVCAGVSLYAGVLVDAVPVADRDVATPTVERVHGTLAANGSLRPGRFTNAALDLPAGYRTNLTLRAGDRRWHRGPPSPGGSAVQVASRPVAVRVGVGNRTAGTLRVAVWT
jgi:hypothetical protein